MKRIILLTIILSLLLVACSQAKDQPQEKESSNTPPSSESTSTSTTTTFDAKAFTQKIDGLIKNLDQSFAKLKEEVPNFQAEVVAGKVLEENKGYQKTKEEVISSLKAIEKQVYPQDYFALRDFLNSHAHQIRFFLNNIEQNGQHAQSLFTSLENNYLSLSQQYPQLIKAIEAGIEFKAIELPNNQQVKTLNSFSPYDNKLRWGASKEEVMAVEGFDADYLKKNRLDYEAKIYTYDAKKTYHFNSANQLNRLSYQMPALNENILTDLESLFFILHYNFGYEVNEDFKYDENEKSYSFKIETESINLDLKAEKEGLKLIEIEIKAKTK